jgi:TonB-linked SusC/RagA family outer membrane protein
MNNILFGKCRNGIPAYFAIMCCYLLSLTTAYGTTSTNFLKSEGLFTGMVNDFPSPTTRLQEMVTGVVKDSEGPMAGVTVSVKGANRGTTTDFDGRYIITAAQSDTLVFSYMGYHTVAVKVVQSVLDVRMEVSAQQLKEVIVNAGYYTVKDKERTGSIARVTASTIEKQPVANVLAAMQGQMAGVAITQATGVPGGGFSIQIRGVNSLRAAGNQPLYIVDGLPFSTESLGNIALSGSIMGGVLNPLNSINPSDIESIEVLKDADATAIYGSRGANGVVLITTKKGKQGKTQFHFDSYTGVGQVTRKLDLLNTEQYLAVREEAFANDGISPLPSWAYDVNGTWDRTRYTDWQKELIGGNAFIRNVSMGVSGGTGLTQFMLKGTHYNETTVFPGDFKYRKSAFHFSVTHSSADKKFNVNFSGNYVGDSNNLLSTDLTRTATVLAPNAPALYMEDGELNWENSTWDNPLRLLEGTYETKVKSLYSGGLLSYALLPSLTVKTAFGYSATNVHEFSTTPSTIYNPAYGLTSAVSSSMVNTSEQQSWNVEPQMQWQQAVGKGKFDVLVGGTFQARDASQLALYGMGYTSNSLLHNIAAASYTQVLNNSSLQYRYSALFGRFNYSLNDKYFINVTGRRDGSSRFGPGNRFANFGAVGVAWLFGNELAVQNGLPFLSFGKLRASYGSTGSDQIGDYQFLNTYTPSGVPYNGVVGLSPVRLFNPDFSWEVNKKFEVALETGYFKNRILLTAAYFKNRSSNQLVGIPLPGTTGFTSVQANLDATVENRGVELELRTVNVSRPNFKWVSTVNLTVPQNELISFPDLEGSVYANQYVIGESLNIRKVYEFTGVDPTTGIYTFKDFNGDGLLTDKEDRQKIVDTSPEYYGGFTNSLTYKNVGLDFMFQFVKQVGVNSNSVTDLPGTASNMPTSILDHWETAGDIAPTQVYTAGFNGDAVNAFYTNFIRSDAAYSDASYVRLKNVSLSYTLPKSVLPMLHCKLYLQGQNLLTITKFQGADPENQMRGQLPTLRVLTAGVQLTF